MEISDQLVEEVRAVLGKAGACDGHSFMEIAERLFGNENLPAVPFAKFNVGDTIWVVDELAGARSAVVRGIHYYGDDIYYDCPYLDDVAESEAYATRDEVSSGKGEEA